MRFELLPYSIEHKNELLNSFDTNVPKYFDPSEREQFSAFLDNINNKYSEVNYFTLIANDKIAGSGGFAVIDSQEARLVWIMVEANLQGRGAGNLIMKKIHDLIDQHATISAVSLQTSQHIIGFYEKLNYVFQEEQKNYWGEGLHLIVMNRAL